MPRSPYIDMRDADLARALNRAAGALEQPLPAGREAEYRERLRLLVIAAAQRLDPPVVPYTDAWEASAAGRCTRCGGALASAAEPELTEGADHDANCDSGAAGADGGGGRGAVAGE